MKYDVFISYSRKDSAIVEKFADELINAGYIVWRDIDGVESGDEFKRKIAAAIRESRVFLYFSSASSNESEWTVKEVNYAIKKKIHIIPIKLDDTNYNESVDFDLCAVNFIQCNGSESLQDAVDKLLRSLKNRIGIGNNPNNPKIKKSVINRRVMLVCLLLFVVVGMIAGFLSFGNDSLSMGTETVAPQPKEDVKTKYDDFKSRVFSVGGVDFKMIAVYGGRFMMGFKDGELDENITHEVFVHDYYIAETEVTQELWTAVMGTYIQVQTDKDLKGVGSNYPMYFISYTDCCEFVNRLNEILADQLPTGRKFRLPTEAEWEFAARGGKNSQRFCYSGDDCIDSVAWYKSNSGGGAHPVKKKSPNELGLYDMSGNIWEWCFDNYDIYPSIAKMDPKVDNDADGYRVLRGGSWDSEEKNCRSTFRNYNEPSNRGTCYGLRLAL